MKNDMFELVAKAQAGDKDALEEVISFFLTSIRHAISKTMPEYRDDIEQAIIELIIKKVLTYDLNSIPDFNSFFQQLKEGSTQIRILHQ
ncbi:helix-turn-helix domain-containing protein [Paenibacillus sp. FSL L8-0436]|uniref:helix-turn-helix domain-containing protein n=1 Tax=Paenibacillus sp. FSL L8-0436 TaxID=2954686 RepID=UPI0031582E6D